MKRKLLTLLVSMFFCAGLTSAVAQTYLSENFASGALPAGWANDSAGMVSSNLWLFNNPYSRSITGVGFDTHFAIFDSDEGSSNDQINENATLTTPLIDISSATVSVFLGLDEQYRGIADTSGSLRTIEYSVDSGATWLLVDTTVLDIGYPNPAVHSEYDLTAAVGHQSIMVRFNFRGSWDWWWAIDNVSVFQRTTCVSPPNAGVAHSSLDLVCPDSFFNFILDSADVALGITYQWQSSPDNTTWTDMTNDTTIYVLNLQQTAMTYYRCAVTCSGNTAYSVVALVDMAPPTQCYCTPTYTFGCDALNKVAINTLLNDSTGCNGQPNNYILYPDTGSLTTTLGTGDSYDFTIASGPGSGIHGAGVWFDFNQDGDFDDADEYYHISDSIPENSADITIQLMISPSALLGSTRMRVRYVYDAAVLSSDDCGDQSFGETEDYNVTITIGSAVEENALTAISVYPNPANNSLRISGRSGKLDLTMMDQTGRLVKSASLTSSYSEINVLDLAEGIYVLRMTDGKNVSVRKIVISH
jgi:hypothetical protein